MFLFFSLLAFTSFVLNAVTLVAGHSVYFGAIPVGTHMLLGLGTTGLILCVHCLIFAIFTGAGKDTRELVQDLGLKQHYLAKVKAFRKAQFPQALYAILFTMLAALIGGARGISSSQSWAGVLHPLLGWCAFFYNSYVMLNEATAVRENARMLREVNSEAAEALKDQPEIQKQVPDIVGVVDAATTQMEWGAHVYAFGKFLVFLGVNVWLPFIYLKYIMGVSALRTLPFFGISALLIVWGYWLRASYHEFRPDRRSQA